MQSRLAIFCEKILEMGWLAALITAPLFFNVYSSRVFEPDKITLVRSIALVMAGAWLIQQVERGFRGLSARTWVKENPLTLPTLAVVLVNVLSTIASVAPAVSLWGSYQRLQGLDTLLSYIAIFFLAASSLRTRAQFDRVINTVILVSFPIAYYGLIQHYKLDPLPWGGDTSDRVAANMGNSIFVAAYLILVVPLNLARSIEALARVTAKTAARWVWIGMAVGAVVIMAVVWTVNFWAGLGTAGLIVAAFLVYGLITRHAQRDVLLLGVYAVHLAILLVAIFFTQSRGPWLGLAGGLFTFALLYALARGTRRFVLGSIALAVVGVLFLTAFNLPNTPLGSLKQVPYVGRLGTIFEDSGTNRVRELIWQGAVPMILPHAPLWSPTTGEDTLNLVRPLIGYGPESMYVAYNPFYPPDLGHLEARNATPDRSHNETFDSLVTTGLLGFAAYIFLFMAVFYFGLQSLGMIESTPQRIAFLALWLGGGFVSTLAFGLWRGWYFLGVALPFGMILGFFVFLVGDALRTPTLTLSRVTGEGRGGSNALWICALLAAFIAHFIEINFGIAIVSTRTYFWFYAALLVILGMNRLVETDAPTAPAPNVSAPGPEAGTSARRRRRSRTPSVPSPRQSPSSEGSLAETLTWTIISVLVLVTLAYEFVTAQSGGASPIDLLTRSLFVKDGNPSYGIFSLIALTWLVAGILGFDQRLRGEARWLAAAIFAILSLTVVMWFVFFQTRWLVETLDQRNNALDRFTYLLGLYYLVVFLAMVSGALVQRRAAAQASVVFARTAANLALMPFVLMIVVVMVYLTNFTAIVGDTFYKVGSALDAQGVWTQSIGVYEAALRLQPDQDFYLLFLGRAYLEAGRATNDAKQRAQLLSASEQRLLRARAINPLNTDHSANLARLNRIWATLSDTAAEKSSRLQKSSDYYRDATRQSPNTAHLYDEWSQVYYLVGDLQNTRAMLEKSLSLDREFPLTYQYLGDFYNAQRDDARAVDYYLKAIQLDPGSLTGPDGLPLVGPLSLFTRPESTPQAIEAYRAAALKDPNSVAAHLAISEIYKRTGQLELARQELEQVVQRKPQDLNANLALVNFLSTNGFIDAAVEAMRRLLELVPASSPDRARMQDFNSQILTLQRAIDAARKAPNDVAAHRTLAGMWRARGQPQFALSEYQTVVRLAPNDYDALKAIALIQLTLANFDESQGAIVAAAANAPDKEKAIWQNLQSALNNQKSRQFDKAMRDAQAAQALAVEADQATIQIYLSQLQALVQSK